MKRLACLLAALPLLVACKSSPATSDDLFDEYDVTLRDGSTITCVTYDRALDCDWRNQ